MIFGIRQANTIDDDGSTQAGYFIRDLQFGMIVGIITMFLINLGFDMVELFINSIKETNFKQENYVIPKKQAQGLYLQLEDGKLYKKQ